MTEVEKLRKEVLLERGMREGYMDLLAATVDNDQRSKEAAAAKILALLQGLNELKKEA